VQKGKAKDPRSFGIRSKRRENSDTSTSWSDFIALRIYGVSNSFLDHAASIQLTRLGS
jgi:hypothetical protein